MSDTPRRITPRHITTLALAGAATGLLGTSAIADFQMVSPPESLWTVQSEGGEGGEGGEAGAPDASTADMDIAYLTALALIEGHLTAGYTLYQAGETEMAQTHMKHPQDEVYADLVDMLTDKNVPDFATELTALADAVTSGADQAVVDDAFATVKAAIATANAAVSEPHDQFEMIEALVRTAATEYSAGVADGAIAELHEYQDAWGFTQVARARAAALMESTDPAVVDAASEVAAAIDDAATAFDGVAPAGSIPGSADQLFGAAALIEFAAAKVK